jgi:hypothetical protein
MEAIGKLFGMGRDKKAEAAAKASADAAHMQAENAKRDRVEEEQRTALAGSQGSGSMFLANRGTRYSGLKPSLGG